MKVSIRMKQTVVLMLSVALQSVCSAAAEPVLKADFYVSPVGSNDWSGTLPNPDAQGTDGPFATLERARDAVRDLKKRKSTDILVLVREGTYRPAETIVFGLQDSANGDFRFKPKSPALKMGIVRTNDPGTFPESEEDPAKFQDYLKKKLERRERQKRNRKSKP